MIWESSFQETYRPGKKPSGNRLSGKRLSGKITVRESYYLGNDCKPMMIIGSDLTSGFVVCVSFWFYWHKSKRQKIVKLPVNSV